MASNVEFHHATSLDQPRRSFTDALREKYVLADDDHNAGESGNSLVIKIDIRGKPKDTSKGAAELGYLRNVVLNESAITHAGLPDTGLKYICPNVVDLDLATNMIEDWNEVNTILCSLPHLKYVNLSRNPLADTQDILTNEDRCFPKIEHLVLNQTNVTWKEISSICRHLAHLKELHICGNGLKNIPEECVEFLHNIDCLRMNGNHFKRWEEIWKLAGLSKLKSLIVSGNPIENIFHVPEDYSNCINCKTRGCKVLNTFTQTEDQNDEFNLAETPETGVAPSDMVNNTNTTDNEVRDDPLSHQGHTLEGGNPYVVKTAAAVCQNIINEVLERVCQRRHSINTDTVTSTDNSDVEMYVSAVTNMMDNHILLGCGSIGDGLPNPSQRENELDKNQRPQGEGKEKEMQEEEGKEAEEKEMTEDMEKIRVCDGEEEQVDEEKSSLQDKDVAHHCPTVPAFSSLENLCLSNSRISILEDIEFLSLYPALKSVRIKDTKFAPDMSDEDKRKLFIASLPNVQILNGSEVTSDERNKSERHFIRYFQKCDSQPKRYETLVKKHGETTDLATVDLRFCEWAEITIVHDNSPIQTTTVHMMEQVGKLRKMIAEEILFIPRRSFRMYHLACGPCHREDQECTFDELFLDGLPLSRFNIMHGDEIHIESLSHSDTPCNIHRGTLS